MLDGVEFDESGWAMAPIEPWPFDQAFSLFSAATSVRLTGAALSAAASHFDTSVLATPKKSFPGGAEPIADAAVLTLTSRGVEIGCVAVVMVPVDRARAAREAAMHVARARGGAGMDALVARARRVLQVQTPDGVDRATLTAAGILATAHSAAILPPGADLVIGPRTIRERIDALP